MKHFIQKIEDDCITFIDKYGGTFECKDIDELTRIRDIISQISYKSLFSAHIITEGETPVVEGFKPDSLKQEDFLFIRANQDVAKLRKSSSRSLGWFVDIIQETGGKAIFLDDMREPVDVWSDSIDFIVTRTVREFKEAVNEHLNELVFVSFDHDLDIGHYDDLKQAASEIKGTGQECAHYLVQKCATEKRPLPSTFVHSANPCGRNAIIKILDV